VANPLEKLLRAGEGRILRRLQQVVKAVGALEEDYAQLTDEELRGETAELRARHEAGESSTSSCPRPSPPCARPPSARSASVLRRPDHGRRGAASRQHRRDEDR
jgi:preprotein translocase subunit SecA